jgi:hypothetical protein
MVKVLGRIRIRYDCQRTCSGRSSDGNSSQDEDLPQQDRNAKLSKPAKSAPPPVILNASELKEIEEAIAKLEQKHSEKKGTKDPFDPSVYNAKFSGEKPVTPLK